MQIQQFKYKTYSMAAAKMYNDLTVWANQTPLINSGRAEHKSKSEITVKVVCIWN